MTTDTRDAVIYYGLVIALIVITVAWTLALLAGLGALAAWVIGTAIPGLVAWADANPQLFDFAVIMTILAGGALAMAEREARR